MSDFVPETEENEEETKPEPNKPVVVDQNFARRFLNNKWYGKYGEDGALLEHLNDDWVPVAEDEQEFLSQLWFEQEEQEKNAHKHYDWDEEKKEWVPKPTSSEEVNEDFIAEYQANYGVQYDDIYKKMDEELHEKAAKAQKEVEEKKEQKKRKKQGLPTEEAKKEGWIDLGDKVHAVYVSNLPSNITDDEFQG
ncbi:Protein CBG18539 [Caenorhabditis briggsae]|uniref:Protein CBG18539 n=1 Tax=Caenorhabditis briggsae TaxID=6238 RepID=A8XTJ1_CAEBR|nr:Protein CBG18539 [Caenorhabditis briggsae]CAP35968.2 Protein CBG18539 [Caenorhabditis briggsae]